MKKELFTLYKKITAEDNMVITNYQEGDETYTYCRTMLMPLDADESGYREIPLEEHEHLLEKFERDNILH